jgi:hypothetical protein
MNTILSENQSSIIDPQWQTRLSWCTGANPSRSQFVHLCWNAIYFLMILCFLALPALCERLPQLIPSVSLFWGLKMEMLKWLTPTSTTFLCCATFEGRREIRLGLAEQTATTWQSEAWCHCRVIHGIAIALYFKMILMNQTAPAWTKYFWIPAQNSRQNQRLLWSCGFCSTAERRMYSIPNWRQKEKRTADERKWTRNDSISRWTGYNGRTSNAIRRFVSSFRFSEQHVTSICGGIDRRIMQSWIRCQNLIESRLWLWQNRPDHPIIVTMIPREIELPGPYGTYSDGNCFMSI